MELGPLVDTPYGEAVLVGENLFRYEAIRCSDNSIIWVLNSADENQIKFLAAPTKETLRIVGLTGPYGV